jgi:uncharacterized protein YndB with AHSA1/START domain
MSDDGKLRIERVIDASPEAVYRTWTTPALMERWYRETPDSVATVTEHELKVGGTFRIEFGTRNTPLWIEDGTYLELDPPNRLVVSETLHNPSEPGMGWTDTRVTVEFLAEGDKTRLVLTHEGLDAEQREGAGGGWPGFIDRLAAIVEG